MSHVQVDNATEELDTAMRQLREALSGIPTNSGKFKRLYEAARIATGNLLVAVTDVAPKVRPE
jgi:hypothetical protein